MLLVLHYLQCTLVSGASSELGQRRQKSGAENLLNYAFLCESLAKQEGLLVLSLCGISFSNSFLRTSGFFSRKSKLTGSFALSSCFNFLSCFRNLNLSRPGPRASRCQTWRPIGSACGSARNHVHPFSGAVLEHISNAAPNITSLYSEQHCCNQSSRSC